MFDFRSSTSTEKKSRTSDPKKLRCMVTKNIISDTTATIRMIELHKEFSCSSSLEELSLNWDRIYRRKSVTSYRVYWKSILWEVNKKRCNQTIVVTLNNEWEKLKKKQTFIVPGYTLIWLNAESFKPVISKTFKHLLICLPYFLVAEGYNKFHKSNNLLKSIDKQKVRE